MEIKIGPLCVFLPPEFFFLKNSKKMPVIVYSSNISSYFNNIIDATKLNDLHSYSIAVSLHYLSTEIKGHNDNSRCHCFKCLVYRSL